MLGLGLETRSSSSSSRMLVRYHEMILTYCDEKIYIHHGEKSLIHLNEATCLFAATRGCLFAAARRPLSATTRGLDSPQQEHTHSQPGFGS